MLGELVNNASPLLIAATEGADEGLSPLVKVVPGLMIWTLLAFGAAVFVLRKWAWPAIAKVLDERQQMIEGSIEEAEKTRAEADQLLEEYRRRLAEAREQADEIVAKARKAAEAAVEEAAAEGREKREEQLAAAKRDIEAETRRSLEAIRREVAELTVLATEKVTRKSLDSADHQRLIEEAQAEVDFSALTGEKTGGAA
jgi:F-type H+-transporting ATPase subunit b